jgi:hypothetical protein
MKIEIKVDDLQSVESSLLSPNKCPIDVVFAETRLPSPAFANTFVSGSCFRLCGNAQISSDISQLIQNRQQI